MLGAIARYQKALDLLAGFDRLLQPERLEAAARPGLRGVLRIAIFWCDQSERTPAATFFAASTPVEPLQPRKLRL
jgi:hypothetical protein